MSRVCFSCRRLALAATRQTAPLARHASSTPARIRPGAPTPRFAPSLLVQQRAAYSAAANASATDAAAAAAPPPVEKPDYLNHAESAIWDQLAAEFTPTELSVQDISGGCGSMYGIQIASEKFRGTNMLKQQRMVNAVLGDQMKNWHGVQLRTRVPS